MKPFGSWKAPVLLALATLFAVTLVSASPEYVVVVNHTTKECSSMYAGDECEICSPREGWQVLEGVFDLEGCPTGYAILDDRPFRPFCTPSKSTFCCTTPHTGSAGDCSDVIVNRATESCAFVEDINACPQLPEGWQAHKTLCPFEYEWVSGIECLSGEGGDPVGNDGASMDGNG